MFVNYLYKFKIICSKTKLGTKKVLKDNDETEALCQNYAGIMFYKEMIEKNEKKRNETFLTLLFVSFDMKL